MQTVIPEVTTEVLQAFADAWNRHDVTECRYAQFFKELGAPELGFLLVCSSDFHGRGFGPDIELKRTRTIMQGASHCDFRYKRQKFSLA